MALAENLATRQLSSRAVRSCHRNWRVAASAAMTTVMAIQLGQLPGIEVWTLPLAGSVAVPMTAGRGLASKLDEPWRSTAGHRLPDAIRIHAIRQPSRTLPTVNNSVPSSPGRFG